MMPLHEDITFFAETTFRNIRKRFGIRKDDRRRHMYIIGKTGMGKSEMLSNMIIQDIQRGNGVAVVDPHGELAEKVLEYVPRHRINDVVYVNPSDLEYPISFNVMENVDATRRHLVASGMMGVFKKIWPDVWSARMEYILNNAILALLEYPGSTLLGVNRMLSDKEYRAKVVEKISDPVVKAFWTTEFARYTQRLEAEATASIQNKVGQFISNPLVRNIIGQVRSKIDMREVMDTKKILIANLSKGKVGEDNSRLLGAMLITKLQLAAMSRVDVPEEERKDFYLYVDEFQNFATESFANILSEARKYRLSLILAHQYIAQIGHGEDTKVRDAVFGNVGTLVCFRVGAEDAEFLEREFEPEFKASDLVNLPKFNIYLKLMINGITSPAFSAVTLPPFPPPEKSFREKIIQVSRERYGTPRSVIEEKISRWWGGVMVSQPSAAGAGSVASPQPPPELFEAECANCGKRTYVTFQPDGKRPVYCKKCLKKYQQDLAARTAARRKESSSETRLPPQNSSPSSHETRELRASSEDRPRATQPPSSSPIADNEQHETDRSAPEGRIAPPPIRRRSPFPPSARHASARKIFSDSRTSDGERKNEPVSLEAAAKSKPQTFAKRSHEFSQASRREKVSKSGVTPDRGEIRKVLRRILKDAPQHQAKPQEQIVEESQKDEAAPSREPEKKEEGVLRPGETITFS